MEFTGRSLISLVTRAAYRYHNSGLWLPGTQATPKIALQAEGAPDRETTNCEDQATSNEPQEVSGAPAPPRSEDAPQVPTEGENADGPSISTSITVGGVSSEPESELNDEPSAEAQDATKENSAASLADLLLNPLPPGLSVDNMISKTLGNIFQKTAIKDQSIQALLDGQEEIDMRDLADELREFADEIGATKS